jgi:molecular chaperone GrpE (heat shock protein)
MRQSCYPQNRQRLRELMQQAGIANLGELSRLSGLSEWQLMRVQCGLLGKMQTETAFKLSEALQVPLSQLLMLFCSDSLLPNTLKQEQENLAELEALKQEYQRQQDNFHQEYQRQQQQMEQQQETLTQEFQESSVHLLESLLVQLPTAAAVAQKNHQFPAIKILPLLKPLTQLLKKWGVEAIGSVGEEIPYNPQWHQLLEGVAEAGNLVKIRYVGYRQGDKLFYRAKVSLVKEEVQQVEEEEEGIKVQVQ